MSRGVEHNSHHFSCLFHSPFGRKTILLQREGTSLRGSLWNRLIRVGSKRFARYRNLSRCFSARNFGPRLKTPSLSCRLLDNMECQINHSPAVNRFDRRKCNFHDKKLCVTCQSRQRNYRKARKAANLHSTVHGFIFSGVLMTLLIAADDKNVSLLWIQQRTWCFVFEQFENTVIDKTFRCLLKRDAWKIPEV